MNSQIASNTQGGCRVWTISVIIEETLTKETEKSVRLMEVWYHGASTLTNLYRHSSIIFNPKNL